MKYDQNSTFASNGIDLTDFTTAGTTKGRSKIGAVSETGIDANEASVISISDA